MQDAASELPRIPLPRTRLNRDKKKEAGASFFLNASLVLDSPFATYRKARPAPQGEGLRLGPRGTGGGCLRLAHREGLLAHQERGHPHLLSPRLRP
jgi:hypothetical protein